jgi:proline iminopeptidase
MTVIRFPKGGWTRRKALAAIASLTMGIGLSRCSAESFSKGGSFIAVNGDRQWLKIAGTLAAKSVLLILHGGPGGSETILFRHFNRALETCFCVAYWDQRGSGRSFDPQKPSINMTVEQFVRDLDVIVEHLQIMLGLPIILIGHSWGSALGLIYAHRHPRVVAGFIGIAQVANTPVQLRASYNFALAEARRRQNAMAVRELEDIGPPPFDVEALRIKDRWVEAFGGYFAPGFPKMRTVLSALVRGETSIGEIRRLIAANDFSLKAMWPEVQILDVPRLVPSVAVPVAFFLGRLDRQVPGTAAESYLKQLQAPRKSLRWFEHAAHNIPFEQPDDFNREVMAVIGGWFPNQHAKEMKNVVH